MKRIPVQSSDLMSVGYDREHEILEVQFKSGTIYHYFNVPIYEYDGLMGADSHGKYLAAHIKGKYDYDRIE